MQSDYKEIYRLTAERTGESEQIYKDLGNYVFAELGRMLRKPPCLIIKLKGIGYWFLRRNRLKIKVDRFPPNFERTKESFSTEDGFLRHENKIEIYNLFMARLAEYDEYLKMKKEVREQRNKTQYLLTPKKDE